MRAIMANKFQRARILAEQEFELGVGLDGVGEIADHTINRHGDGLLGERFGDALDNGAARNAGLILARGAIGNVTVIISVSWLTPAYKRR